MDMNMNRCLSAPGPAERRATLHMNRPQRRWSTVLHAVSPSTTAHASETTSSQPRACVVHDFGDQLVPYEQAWAWQKQQVDRACSSWAESDSVFLLQHPPTYTLGAGSTVDNLKFSQSDSPLPLFRVERGGEVTYHGPGQLVMYPILNLQRHQPDLHWYLRNLEEVVIRALYEVSGLRGERIPGLTGVWVDGHKVAAIGVRAKKWVTFHGLALNVCPDLGPFKDIVPCGIKDKPVGSVAGLLQQQQQQELSPEQQQAAHRELLLEYRFALLDALSDVFGLELTVDEEATASLVAAEAAVQQ